MKLTNLTVTDLTTELRARLALGKAPAETRILTGLLRSVRAELNTRACAGDLPAAFALECGAPMDMGGDADAGDFDHARH